VVVLPLVTRSGADVAPPPERAWNTLAGTCTARAAYLYRGTAPSVRQPPGRSTLITGAPAGGRPPLTLAYVRDRGILLAYGRLQPGPPGGSGAARRPGLPAGVGLADADARPNMTASPEPPQLPTRCLEEQEPASE
jgi:hypothetical protein